MMTHCGACGFGDKTVPTRWTNVLDTGANLVECADCGVRFYDQPKLMHLAAAAFYNAPAYDAYIDRHVENGSPFMNTPEKREYYERIRGGVYEGILDKLERAVGTLTRLYEAGASWGLFLKVAHARGIEATGCDMSRRAAELADGHVEHSPFLDATVPDALDAVVSLDVIEHTETPGADLARAFEVLRPGGGIVVKTFYDEWHDTADIDLSKPAPSGLPDIDNYLKAGYFGRSHIHHFTTEALRNAIEGAGFGISLVVPHETCGQVEMYGVKP